MTDEEQEILEWDALVLSSATSERYPTWPATAAAIERERFRQNTQWGGPAHDDTHALGDWLEYITKQIAKAATALDKGDDHEAEQRLIKIAALAVAAIESTTRKDMAENG